MWGSVTTLAFFSALSILTTSSRVTFKEKKCWLTLTLSSVTHPRVFPSVCRGNWLLPAAGHDGVLTAAEGIRIAGKPDPKAVREALWKVNAMGVNGPIKFEKDGPAGKESGQSQPSIFIVQIKDGKITLPAFVKKS